MYYHVFMLCRITGGDRKLFGEASYQLGLAFINIGEPQTALKVCTHCWTKSYSDTL